MIPVELKVKIFADGADLQSMVQTYKENQVVRGFTTNPTLMRKAGVNDYEAFAKSVLAAIPDRPISFEVFSDDFDEMEVQARRISSFGENVYVKIPISNTRGESSAPLIRRLANANVKQNVTALMTLEQVSEATDALSGGPAANISVFAGRIADTGRDPLKYMKQALQIMSQAPQLELIWASPREAYNIMQANDIGCHIITATNDLIGKISLFGKDLTEYSKETVQMFFDDAQEAGFCLNN